MKKRGNGEGTVFKRKDGLFCAAKYIAGKRISAYGKDKTAAIRKLQQKIKSEIEAGTLNCAMNNITFKEWLPIYIRKKSGVIRDSTLTSYWTVGKRASKYIGNEKLRKITNMTISTLADRLTKDGYKRSTTAITVALVVHLVNEAIDLDVIVSKKISTKGKVKKAKKDYLLPSPEDVVRCVSGISDSIIRAMALFCLYTGLRRGELVGLQWSDINLTDGKMYIKRSIVPKSKHSGGGCSIGAPKNGIVGQAVQIPDDGIILLKELKAGYKMAGVCSPYVFCRKNGNIIPPSQVSRVIHDALSPLVPHGSVHLLRHVNATILAMNKVPLRTISHQLRHSSIAITSLYINEIVGESYDEITGISLPGCCSVDVEGKKNKP